MEGYRSIFLLTVSSMIIIATLMPVACGIIDQSPEGVEKWFGNICLKNEKTTKVQFYLHDILSGTSPTAVSVARANMTATSSTFFGLTIMMDDPLTIGPEPNSTELGRAQGMYAFADMNVAGILMTFNVVFTSGNFNGSTLSVLGKNPVTQKYREMPIVGGTGVFRLARGIVTAQMYKLNPITFDAIIRYNAIVIHY